MYTNLGDGDEATVSVKEAAVTIDEKDNRMIEWMIIFSYVKPFSVQFSIQQKRSCRAAKKDATRT